MGDPARARLNPVGTNPTPEAGGAYPLVPLDASLSQVDAKLLVECGKQLALISRVRARANDDGPTFRLQAHIDDGRVERLWDVPANRSIRSAVAALTGLAPTRAFQLPPGKVHRSFPVTGIFVRTFLLLGVAGVLLAGVVFFIQGDDSILLGGLLLGVALVSGHLILQSRIGRSEWLFAHDGQTHRLRDMRQPEQLATVDIDDVKEEYGRLLSDIAYRIEYPALFDPHVTTTRSLTVALLQWDNNQGLLSYDESRALAARVRGAFQAARQHAESVGMNHLPQEARSDAQTALAAARLAADTRATSAERQTALQKAIAILDSLALYYLPTGADARRAIEGRTILALPGRRST